MCVRLVWSGGDDDDGVCVCVSVWCGVVVVVCVYVCVWCGVKWW